VSDERALQRRHADPTTIFNAIIHYLLHLPSLELHLFRSISIASSLPISVKVREERSGLLWNGIVDESCQVNATGPDERRIESVQVVRREEYDSLFARGDTVQGVQEPREGHGRLISVITASVNSVLTHEETRERAEGAGRPLRSPASPVFARLHALIESGIDIFDENEAPFWHVRHQVVELVVGQATLGEIEQAYVVR